MGLRRNVPRPPSPRRQHTRDRVKANPKKYFPSAHADRISPSSRRDRLAIFDGESSQQRPNPGGSIPARRHGPIFICNTGSRRVYLVLLNGPSEPGARETCSDQHLTNNGTGACHRRTAFRRDRRQTQGLQRRNFSVPFHLSLYEYEAQSPVNPCITTVPLPEARRNLPVPPVTVNDMVKP